MKTQFLYKLILVGAILTMVVTPAFLSHPQPTRAAAGLTLRYQDDFQDGNFSQASSASELTWQVISGEAGIDSVDGSLQLGVDRGGSLVVTNQTMGTDEYTLCFDGRITWSEPGRIVVLYENPQNYYSVGLGSETGIYRMLDGVEVQLHADPQDLVRLPHGSGVTGEFKVYAHHSGSAIIVKADRAGDGIDYDIEIHDTTPAALAKFTDTRIGMLTTSEDSNPPWFYLDNVQVFEGLELDPYTPVTYFVDQGHPQASDANSGTESEPWLTIQKAADTVLAGDTVLVKPGSYDERITFGNRTRGAPGQVITFRAEPRRTVTMWGFYTRYAHYLRVEGFNITTDDSLTGWTEQDGVFIDSDHVEIVDNYLYDLEGTAISGDSVGAYVAGNRVYRSQMGITVSGEGWLVEGNEVERLYNYGGGDSDYSRFFGDDHVLRGNFFHGTDFSEIGDAHVDCFQTFDNNGEHAYNILFDGNTCYDFHQGFMGEAAYYGNTSDLTFQNNIFAHGGAWGLSVHQIRDVTVVHNVFADIRYHGAGFRDGATGIVRNNIFYNAGSNYWASDGGTVEGGYNLLYESGDTIDPGDFPNDLVNRDPLFVDAANDDYHILGGSPAIDAGMNAGITYDLDGNLRPQGTGYDIGAYEFTPALELSGMPGNGTVYLSWEVNVTLPGNATWEINYSGPAGDEPSPVGSLPGSTRSYTLSGMTNYTSYTLTLTAWVDAAPFLTDTVVVIPTDRFLYLPVGLREH
jgi:hypothetical protein